MQPGQMHASGKPAPVLSALGLLLRRTQMYTAPQVHPAFQVPSTPCPHAVECCASTLMLSEQFHMQPSALLSVVQGWKGQVSDKIRKNTNKPLKIQASPSQQPNRPGLQLRALPQQHLAVQHTTAASSRGKASGGKKRRSFSTRCTAQPHWRGCTLDSPACCSQGSVKPWESPQALCAVCLWPPSLSVQEKMSSSVLHSCPVVA